MLCESGDSEMTFSEALSVCFKQMRPLWNTHYRFKTIMGLMNNASAAAKLYCLWNTHKSTIAQN